MISDQDEPTTGEPAPASCDAAPIYDYHARIGIALGAGAARGWSHIGVLERLLEAGIKPSVIAGTSIGALVGGCYASDRLAELKEFALSLTRRRMFSFLDIAWGGSGLISGDRLSALLDEQLGEMNFSHTRLPFICIRDRIDDRPRDMA